MGGCGSIRFLSSTLLPFLAWALLIETDRKKGALVMKGLLRNLEQNGMLYPKPLAARARRRPVPLNATASRSACFAKQIESARPDLALLAMGHNSKIGYPYLPAREPWRGRDVLQRAWRATLAGMAGDSGGDGGRRWRGLGGRLW